MEGARQMIKANNLWTYRRKNALPQKKVAFLLDHKTTSQLSHYERGIKYPSLLNALKLEIIYNVPVAFLFSDLYRDLRDNLQARKKESNILFPEK